MNLKIMILYKLYFISGVSGVIAASYADELEQSIKNGQVQVLKASSRSIEHKVLIRNNSPSLVIFCYTPGATQRTFLSLWKTVKFQLLSAGETNMVYGESEGIVYRQWLDHSGIIRNWFTPWKVDSLVVTPFNATCIGASSVENKDFNINLVISAIDPWLVANSLIGLTLFLSAKRLSTNIVFHYGSGVSLGLLASLLIMLFILSRFIPKKSAAYSLLAFGFSLTAWFLQYIKQNIHSLLESYLQYFIIYFTVAGVVSFAVCYYKGPVTNPRIHNLIKWFIQLIAIAFIYNSSYIPELSATIFIAIVVSSYVPLRFPVLKTSTHFWRRWFRPKIRLLTEEEYVTQGIEETRKALEELRLYCHSPNCDSWKTISRLNSPVQFANWMAGNSDHFSGTEMYEHERNPSPNLSFDDLSDDE